MPTMARSLVRRFFIAAPLRRPLHSKQRDVMLDLGQADAALIPAPTGERLEPLADQFDLGQVFARIGNSDNAKRREVLTLRRTEREDVTEIVGDFTVMSPAANNWPRNGTGSGLLRSDQR
jgi:hypothetical protein